ncbi:MAG: hypothetical protein M3Y77_11070 [Actinomycetota bacterium]|nr:hypothetical protein [Actinomycetota bacterium]
MSNNRAGVKARKVPAAGTAADAIARAPSGASPPAGWAQTTGVKLPNPVTTTANTDNADNQ